MFETKRLLIQHWTEADAEVLMDLSHDRGLTDNTIADYRQKSIESAKTWIKENPFKWAVWEKESNTIVGLGGITPIPFEEEILPDVTYRIRESHWGRGLGLELASGIIHFGFDKQNRSELTVTNTPHNLASKKIASKLGFHFEREILLYGVTTHLYRLRKSS
jgi:RimJ/RimL family protein N-acetyltransferase